MMTNKLIKFILIFISILIFTACGNNQSNTNTSEEEGKDSILSGKIIDGEISGATIFLDLNRNQILDEDEPQGISNADGTYTLALTTKDREHKNYKNKRARIIVYGGVDIRTNEPFEDYLTAIREENNGSNITPLTTLISESIGDNLSEADSLTLESMEKKIDEIKNNLAELFNIKKELLTKDPIALAKEGDNALLSTSLQMHKVAKNMKKAMKGDVKDLRIAIISSYRALAKEFKVMKRSSIKSGNSVLTEALESALDNGDIFDASLVVAVKEESRTLSQDIQKFWSNQKGKLDDDNLNVFMKDIEVLVVNVENNVTNVIETNSTSEDNTTLPVDNTTVTTPSTEDNTTSEDNTTIAKALRDADASLISEETIYKEMNTFLNNKINQCNEDLNYIFKDAYLSHTFDDGAKTYVSSFKSSNTSFLIKEYRENVFRHFGWMGKTDNSTKYIFAGYNPFIANEELENALKQMLRWLAKDEDIFDKNLSILSNHSNVENWVNDNNFTNWTVSRDLTSLDSTDYDVVILRSPNTKDDIVKALSKDIPVLLYTNGQYLNKSEVLEPLGLASIWSPTRSVSVNNFDSVDTHCQKELFFENSVVKTVNNLKNNTLGFDFSNCTENIGKVSCSDKYILNDNEETLGAEFKDGVDMLRDEIEAQDLKGQNIFDLSDEDNFLKLAILLGDKYRENISYPMDKLTTEQNVFFKAYFADHLVHYSKPNNILQKDLGNFSTQSQSIHDLDGVDDNITLLPTTYSEWTTTGFYAKPGATISIKRTDTSLNIVKVKFNMLRSASTREWNENLYLRPKFMQSHVITLEVGKEYNISTPYGGPIYIYSEASTSPTEFTLAFKNIVKHPTLLDLSPEGISKFKTEFESPNNIFDWVDVKTPFIEIHALKDRFKGSYTTAGFYPYDGDLELYLKELKIYLSDTVFGLAGFAGEGLSLSNELQTFCSNNNLDCTGTIHNKPKAQHINVDFKASCGAACSGNPYDTAGFLTPTNQLDAHEIGHGLQRKRLKIYDKKSTEVSNLLFPDYVNWTYMINNNISEHQSLKMAFNSSALELVYDNSILTNPLLGISNPLWTRATTYQNVKSAHSFYRQLVSIEQSWDIITKLYLIERLFTDAILTDEKWEQNKDKLGFANYLRKEVTDISAEDFMSIVLSNITDKDYISYFAMWGIDISSTAKLQIATNGTSAIKSTEYFVRYTDKVLAKLASKTVVIDSSKITKKDFTDDIEVSYTINSDAIHFVSKYDTNGATTSINTGTEGYMPLTIKAIDSEKNEVTINLRASKSITSNGINGTMVAMNDKTIGVNPSTLLIWMEAGDNPTLDITENYLVKDIIIIEARDSNDEMLEQLIIRFPQALNTK